MIKKILRKSFIISSLLVFSIFLLDRLSKIYVIYLDKKFLGSELLSSKFLNIRLIWNEGIAFGLLSFNETIFYNALTFLILIIIGGSFFSTSSGLRFSKLFLLFKFSINELISHAKPKNVYSNKLPFFNIYLDTEDYYKYFLSVVIFVISLSILSLFLTVSGISSEISFKLSILTLMNTVNSPLTNLENFNFYDLGVSSKFSLILFMMIGRVELLSILIILKKFFFKS